MSRRLRRSADAALLGPALLLLGALSCERESASVMPGIVFTPARAVRASTVSTPETPPGGSHYVAPGGRASAAGTLEDPWDLPTALSQPKGVRPGDVIWLRGGTYRGSFSSELAGSPGRPIMVRSYAGERATLDGGALTSESVLLVEGAWCTFQDVEVTCSTNANPDGNQHSRPEGVTVRAPNTAFVDMIVHDTGQGFGFWIGARDSEISGCLVYYNGNNQLDHGIYAQNQTGTKRIVDNVVFRNYGFGIHAYTTNTFVNNIAIEGNASFLNGRLNPLAPYRSNILIGAGRDPATSCTSSPQVAQNPTLIGNATYHPASAGGREIDLGYSTGSCNPTAVGNYLAGDTTLNLGPAFGAVTITGNTFYGPVSGFDSKRFPDNTYLSSRPSGPVVLVRPSTHEPGRANIIVYNWSLAPALSIELGSVLSVGTAFEIRDAQNFFGPAVVSGTYRGGAVTIPMAGFPPAAPVGRAAPPATGPAFNVFVVLPRGASRKVPAPGPRPTTQPRSIPTRPPGPA